MLERGAGSAVAPGDGPEADGGGGAAVQVAPRLREVGPQILLRPSAGARGGAHTRAPTRSVSLSFFILSYNCNHCR